VKIRYTGPALADLSSLLDYIASHSPQGAKRVQARVQAVIDLLAVHPHVGVRTDDPRNSSADNIALPLSYFLRGYAD